MNDARQYRDSLLSQHSLYYRSVVIDKTRLLFCEGSFNIGNLIIIKKSKISDCTMLYLSICKDYQKISLYFLTGMAAALACALFFVKVCGREIVYSMLLSLTIGFFLTAVLEYATVTRYFKRNRSISL